MNTLSFAGKSAELAITSYLAYLTREEKIEKICFILVQYAIEFCPISKNLGDIAKFLTNI